MQIDAPPEARLWNALRVEPLKPLHFRRQVPFGLYYADFASHTAKLIIEVDGAQHFDNDALAYNAQRTAYLQSRGYRVMRGDDDRCSGQSRCCVPHDHRGRGPPHPPCFAWSLLACERSTGALAWPLANRRRSPREGEGVATDGLVEQQAFSLLVIPPLVGGRRPTLGRVKRYDPPALSSFAGLNPGGHRSPSGVRKCANPLCEDARLLPRCNAHSLLNSCNRKATVKTCA